MVRVAVALAMVVLLVGACSGGGGPSSKVQEQSDRYAIGQLEVTWHQASSRKDVNLMMSIWAKDATFTTASKTYTGSDQIRAFFTDQAAPFKATNNWVSDTPAYKTRITVDGDKGTLYFECDYIDIDTRAVKVVVSADQTVARINGQWLITSAVSATPDLGGY